MAGTAFIRTIANRFTGGTTAGTDYTLLTAATLNAAPWNFSYTPQGAAAGNTAIFPTGSGNSGPFYLTANSNIGTAGYYVFSNAMFVFDTGGSKGLISNAAGVHFAFYNCDIYVINNGGGGGGASPFACAQSAYTAGQGNTGTQANAAAGSGTTGQAASRSINFYGCTIRVVDDNDANRCNALATDFLASTIEINGGSSFHLYSGSGARFGNGGPNGFALANNFPNATSVFDSVVKYGSAPGALLSPELTVGVPAISGIATNSTELFCYSDSNNTNFLTQIYPQSRQNLRGASVGSWGTTAANLGSALYRSGGNQQNALVSIDPLSVIDANPASGQPATNYLAFDSASSVGQYRVFEAQTLAPFFYFNPTNIPGSPLQNVSFATYIATNITTAGDSRTISTGTTLNAARGAVAYTSNASGVLGVTYNPIDGSGPTSARSTAFPGQLSIPVTWFTNSTTGGGPNQTNWAFNTGLTNYVSVRHDAVWVGGSNNVSFTRTINRASMLANTTGLPLLTLAAGGVFCPRRVETEDAYFNASVAGTQTTYFNALDTANAWTAQNLGNYMAYQWLLGNTLNASGVPTVADGKSVLVSGGYLSTFDNASNFVFNTGLPNSSYTAATQTYNLKTTYLSAAPGAFAALYSSGLRTGASNSIQLLSQPSQAQSATAAPLTGGTIQLGSPGLTAQFTLTFFGADTSSGGVSVTMSGLGQLVPTATIGGTIVSDPIPTQGSGAASTTPQVRLDNLNAICTNLASKFILAGAQSATFSAVGGTPNTPGTALSFSWTFTQTSPSTNTTIIAGAFIPRSTGGNVPGFPTSVNFTVPASQNPLQLATAFRTAVLANAAYTAANWTAAVTGDATSAALMFTATSSFNTNGMPSNLYLFGGGLSPALALTNGVAGGSGSASSVTWNIATAVAVPTTQFSGVAFSSTNPSNFFVAQSSTITRGSTANSPFITNYMRLFFNTLTTAALPAPVGGVSTISGGGSLFTRIDGNTTGTPTGSYSFTAGNAVRFDSTNLCGTFNIQLATNAAASVATNFGVVFNSCTFTGTTTLNFTAPAGFTGQLTVTLSGATSLPVGTGGNVLSVNLTQSGGSTATLNFAVALNVANRAAIVTGTDVSLGATIDYQYDVTSSGAGARLIIVDSGNDILYNDIPVTVQAASGTVTLPLAGGATPSRAIVASLDLPNGRAYLPRLFTASNIATGTLNATTLSQTLAAPAATTDWTTSASSTLSGAIQVNVGTSFTGSTAGINTSARLTRIVSDPLFLAAALTATQAGNSLTDFFSNTTPETIIINTYFIKFASTVTTNQKTIGGVVLGSAVTWFTSGATAQSLSEAIPSLAGVPQVSAPLNNLNATIADVYVANTQLYNNILVPQLSQVRVNQEAIFNGVKNTSLAVGAVPVQGLIPNPS